jgi:hypothetical protein
MNKLNIECSREELYKRINEENSEEYIFTEREEEELVEADFLETEVSDFDEKDYRCDRSAIDHHSAVDGSCLAAEDVNLITSQIRRQKHAVECTPNSYDGKTCLISETNQRDMNEEVLILKGPGSITISSVF